MTKAQFWKALAMAGTGWTSRAGLIRCKRGYCPIEAVFARTLKRKPNLKDIGSSIAALRLNLDFASSVITGADSEFAMMRPKLVRMLICGERGK